MADISVGTEIAGYRIESVIGRGGMAVVYRAEDTRLGRKVALKLLAPVLADSEQFRQRFIRESRLAASLDHPNIVPIYEAGETDGVLFIAMRYVRGSDLKTLLTDEGLLRPARLLRLFVQIGDALDAAHVLGLVHRDVKPGNILITSAAERSGHGHPDHVYLTDFGLTKRTSSLSGSLTGTGHFLGTVDYVSPEQIQGAPVGPATDIYALGCVLHECLTGQLPFHRDDDAAVLWAHLVEMPPPVTVARPDLPGAVDGVVARAMAKSPEDRYDSCRDLIRDLEYALSAGMELDDPDHAATRPPPRHTRPATDATGEPARMHPGVAPGPLNAGALNASALDAGADTDVVPESEETQRWVSHPSLPPGAMGPRPWPTPAPAESGPPSGPGVPSDADEDAIGPEWAAEEDRFAEGGSGVPGEAGSASEEVRAEEEPAERAAPAAPRRPWLRRVAVAVVVLALAVIAGVVLLQTRAEEAYRTYTSTDAVVPFSLRVPESWQAKEGPASDVVLSPRPDDVADAFFPSPEGAWQRTTRLLGSSPGEAVGVYAYAQFSSTEATVEELRSAIGVLLPNATVRFDPTHRQIALGGAVAHEFEGTLSSPAGTGSDLRAIFDLVQPAGGGSVLVTFFAPPQEFGDRLPVFTRVRDGLRFPG